MGLVDRIERKLESTVGDAFARVFGGSIVPQEVKRCCAAKPTRGVRDLHGGRVLAPNDYVITLSVPDYQKVSADPDLTSTTFAKHLEGYIHEQGWQTYGDVVVRFEQSPQPAHRTVPRAWCGQPATRPPGGTRPTTRDHAYTAEPGVPPMTDNPSYRGGQGQGRPGDEYYDRSEAALRTVPTSSRRPDTRRPTRAATPATGRPGLRAARGLPRAGRLSGPGRLPTRATACVHDSVRRRLRPAARRLPDQGYRLAPATAAPGGQPRLRRPGGPADDYDYGRPPGRRRGRLPAPAVPSYPTRVATPSRPATRAGGYPDQGGVRRGGRGVRPQGYAQPDYGRYGEPAGYADRLRPRRVRTIRLRRGCTAADYAARAAVDGATVTLQLDDGSGRTYQLREGANVIGRGQDAQFRLPDTGVSRGTWRSAGTARSRCCRISTPPTAPRSNNAPVQEWQLADGDVIRLGHSEIIVRVH